MPDVVVSAAHYGYLACSLTSYVLRRRCLSFPLRIHLQTQTRCNARCAMCPHPDVSRTWTHGRMDWAFYDVIARQIAEAGGPRTVVFDLQNEPLLNQDIFSWMLHMKQRAPAARCVLITNGALLHRYAPADIEASRVDLIAVSLNAHTAETYARLNCGLEFDLVKENILRLAEVPALKTKLRLDFVETRENEHELDAATSFWRTQGVRVYRKPLSNRASALKSYVDLSPPGSARVVAARTPAASWLSVALLSDEHPVGRHSHPLLP
jgi:MoaA/NifB/PqqE/SkfB family radical SAM enzyme